MAPLIGTDQRKFVEASCGAGLFGEIMDSLVVQRRVGVCSPATFEYLLETVSHGPLVLGRVRSHMVLLLEVRCQNIDIDVITVILSAHTGVVACSPFQINSCVPHGAEHGWSCINNFDCLTDSNWRIL